MMFEKRWRQQGALMRLVTTAMIFSLAISAVTNCDFQTSSSFICFNLKCPMRIQNIEKCLAKGVGFGPVFHFGVWRKWRD